MMYLIHIEYVNHLNQTTSLAHKKVAVKSKYVSRFGEKGRRFGEVKVSIKQVLTLRVECK